MSNVGFHLDAAGTYALGNAGAAVQSVNVNTADADATVTLYDAVDGETNEIASIDASALGTSWLNVSITRGLTVVVTGTPDVTITVGPELTGAQGVTGSAGATGPAGPAGPPTVILTHVGAPTSDDGTFATGDQALDTDNVLFVCRAGGTPGTWECPPGQTIATAVITTGNQYPITGSSLDAVDPGNVAISVTPPPSGNIILEVDCLTYVGSGTPTFDLGWIDDATSDQLGGLQQAAGLTVGLTNCLRQLIEGLEPGVEILIDLAAKINSDTGYIVNVSGYPITIIAESA